MGTSIKMLEQHYSHFKVSDNPDRFAGHELRATRIKQKAEKENGTLMKQLVEQKAKQNEQIQQLLEKLLEK